MSKKNLCTPLSTLLRRTLTSFPQHFTYNFPPQTKLSLPQASPSIAPSCHNPTCDYYYYSLRFFGKSKSSEEIQPGCWNCRASPHLAPFLFCDSCRSIQPVDGSTDYFDIFGLERKYDLEGENLEGKYKEWQKKLHPDLVHSKSQKERDFAAEQSARVIDAYRTLSKPLSRGIYLLKLYGVEIDEEQTISDPELLAEILEIREEVEEASNSEALNRILSQMQEKLQNWSNVFGHAFQSQNFEEAKLAIRRMTYYSRVIDEDTITVVPALPSVLYGVYRFIHGFIALEANDRSVDSMKNGSSINLPFDLSCLRVTYCFSLYKMEFTFCDIMRHTLSMHSFRSAACH
ncbi:hypothetical protein VNO78_21167 [Psophocarpus tetragonolobus]|uniref:J domain-containing protein n=1 Tax=Psophocarpus tetragonolobus TaxID=3891 RepID=A0AAN9XHX7_PSOTE